MSRCSEVESAIAETLQIDVRLRRVFERIPEDRLTWSPAPTARSAIELVAHCGFSLGFIGEMLEGTPYPAATMEQADAEFRAMEKTIGSREAALDLWGQTLRRFLGVLNGIGEGQLDDSVLLPFGLGKAPMRAMLGIGAIHTREHVAQLEYLQTAYGDRVW